VGIKNLTKEPFNLVVAGVGGQGNVLLSTFIGTALIDEGFKVGVSDTFGVSQRGGPVTSHIKVSKMNSYSSLTLEGKADAILGMEPVETLRALGNFGNTEVITIVNPRPIYPPGGGFYPDLNEIRQLILELSLKAKFVNATDEALKMGAPIYTNIILLGAFVGAGVLPISSDSMVPILKERFPGKIFDNNIKAFYRGLEIIDKN